MRPGTVIADRFEVDRLAGSGGMGAVYRARDRLSGEPIAVKLMHPAHAESAPRFAREAQLLAELRHPGIVRYVAHGETEDGERYLAMEWLEGETLSERLARRGLTPGESWSLAILVADALAAAHARGVVHRDLKPSNIFLVGGALDDVRLIDFGIASAARGGAPITLAGTMLGTPSYMAPEQARGERVTDARADVFALGCVLFKCLTGRPPFTGEDALAILLRVVMDDAPAPSRINHSVPKEADALIARLLAKAPEARPEHAGAAAELLRALGPLPQGPEVPTSDAMPALTAIERRMLCLVLARRGRRSEERARSFEPDERESALRRLVERYGARLELLADGTLAAVLASPGAATDLAARAARLALAIRAISGGAPMALVALRGSTSPTEPVGELLERGARALGVASSAGVRLDEVMGALLERRFDVGRDDRGFVLRGEGGAPSAVRPLLGKPVPCEGREKELVTLELNFDSCAAEPAARVVLVTAPAGAGKTRLRIELCRRLARRASGEIEIWSGGGDPMRAGSPFELVGSALRGALGVQEGEAPVERRARLRERLAARFEGAELDRMIDFLGELAGAPPEGEEGVQLRAARRDPMLMGDQMRRAFEDFLAAECAARPVLIVLEDLQWGDLPSVKLVDAVLRNLADRPFMVLALARPEVREVFPGLWAQRDVQEIRLAPLSRRAAEKIVRAVLGDRVKAEDLPGLCDRAAGNAFYLEELIRAVAEGRGDALPETVLAMVQARLEGLDAEARRVLRAASVFGQTFWEGGVAELLGGPRATQVAEWLDALADRELVTRRGEGRFAGERELAFRDALVREAAYATLTDGDRALGHRLAGLYLERAGERNALVVAEHFERGGAPSRALRSYARAAEQALEGNDLAGVIALTARGRACGAEGEALGELLALAAEAHNWRGELALAETSGVEAMRLLPLGTSRWYGAAAEASIAASRLGHARELTTITAALMDLARGGEASDAQAVTTARAATQLFFLGRFDDADRLLDRLSAIVAEGALAGRPAVDARIQTVRAWRALFAGDPSEFIALSALAVERFTEAGDVRNASSARTDFGYGCMQVGAYADAERALREGLAIAERLALANGSAVAQHNLGLVLAHLGRLDEARAIEAAAVEVFIAQGSRRMVAFSRVYLAYILARLGRLEEAENEASAALEVTAELTVVRPHALAMLAHVRLALGRAADALALAEEAVDLLATAGSAEEAEAFIHLVHAEARRATGDDEGARAAITSARDGLLARAEKIADAASRDGFLRDVPENARTLALAIEWQTLGS